MERSITLKFPMILPLSRESEPLLRRCVGLSTVIITDGSHNRSGRWDNIVSGGAAGERLNRARLGIRVPGCSIAWGLGGLGPAICRGEFLLLERSRSIVAQTVAVGRCFEFLPLPFIERSVTLYSSIVTVSNTSLQRKDWNFWYLCRNSLLLLPSLTIIWFACWPLQFQVSSFCHPKQSISVHVFHLQAQVIWHHPWTIENSTC